MEEKKPKTKKTYTDNRIRVKKDVYEALLKKAEKYDSCEKILSESQKSFAKLKDEYTQLKKDYEVLEKRFNALEQYASKPKKSFWKKIFCKEK